MPPSSERRTLAWLFANPPILLFSGKIRLAKTCHSLFISSSHLGPLRCVVMIVPGVTVKEDPPFSTLRTNLAARAAFALILLPSGA